MTPGLSWTQRDGVIALTGRIDENADLEALAAAVPADGGTFDLSGLTRINSIGVREWMDFIARLSPRPIRLARCAPAFVDQLNAIANFSGAAEVLSVLTAFECESDGTVVNVEAKLDDVRAGTLPLSPRCPRCGAETVPAQDNEHYFRFLRYRR
jgi:hypothetical protein